MFRKAFSKGKNKGFTLVEIMFVVAIIALLVGISIPGLLRARMTSYDSMAQAILKTISNACELYAAENAGQYPTAIEDLTEALPPYLNENYIAVARRGYNFTCDALDVSGYSCTAKPVTCNQTGTKDFTITTGAVLISADCS